MTAVNIDFNRPPSVTVIEKVLEDIEKVGIKRWLKYDNYSFNFVSGSKNYFFTNIGFEDWEVLKLKDEIETPVKGLDCVRYCLEGLCEANVEY